MLPVTRIETWWNHLLGETEREREREREREADLLEGVFVLQ